MGHARAVKSDTFTDVIEKIQTLNISQQNFLRELLSSPEKVATASKKKLLKKSYGIWAGRKDIEDSAAYVDDFRAGWGSRLERMKD